MSFLQRTPFFRLLLPLIVGIVFYQLMDYDLVYLYPSLILSLALIFSSKFIQQPNKQFNLRWLFGVGVFFFIFSLGVFLATEREQSAKFQNINEKGIFQIEIYETPVVKENSVLCRIKTQVFFDSLQQQQTTHGKAILYIAKDSNSVQLASGDRLLIETNFRKPDGVVNPDGFDYAGYLKRQSIGATAYIGAERWKFLSKNTDFSIFRLAGKLQQKLLEVYHRFGIEGDEFAVLAALTLGSKDALHPELRQNYTTSGGMHILAVSGLHVGVIYMVLSFLFRFLDRKPKLRLLKATLIVILLWGYALITGLPPSVIRSTLMFSLVAIGAGLERKSQIYNTISFSAFVMLLINPDYLFDVGFQLSYSAVISIVYFQPKIKNWFAIKNKPLRWAWELTAVSLAAQIGTAAFSVYYFHQFPNYFLITNFVAIPFATFIIYVAVALFVSSPVPYLSVAVAFVLKCLLIALNYSIEFIHNLPFSLTITSINFWQVILVFLAIILFTVYLNNKQFKPLFSALILILIFFGLNIYTKIQTSQTDRFIVFSDNKNTNINIVEGNHIYYLSTDSTSLQRISANFLLQNKMEFIENIETTILYNEGFIEFNGKRFLLLTDTILKGKSSTDILKIDYLIIANKLKPRIDQLLTCVMPAEIIVDKSISEWYTGNIRKVCVERNIRFYSVAEKGAYILNFSK